jgi:hypothetical protein
MSQFWGHDLISPKEGNRIRRDTELELELQTKYDNVIEWRCYDEDLPYVGNILQDDILQRYVIVQKQKIKENWNMAKQGDADAQNEVGRYYQNGIGVAKDDAEATSWYRRAADQGHANAQDNLGWMYQNGLGVAQNYVEAVSWYRKAADQGHANAQNNVGWMYQNGLGVTQDETEAVKWYRLAAKQGNTYAQNNLKKLTEK